MSSVCCVPDGIHTLTCALMLLNTDLHGHVSTACRAPRPCSLPRGQGCPCTGSVAGQRRLVGREGTVGARPRPGDSPGSTTAHSSHSHGSCWQQVSPSTAVQPSPHGRALALLAELSGRASASARLANSSTSRGILGVWVPEAPSLQNLLQGSWWLQTGLDLIFPSQTMKYFPPVFSP